MSELKIGDLDAGGVYVGTSASTGLPLHAALADEAKFLSLREAFKAAEEMKKQSGRENAHVPTPEELNQNLYKNKDAGALKGTFNANGSFPETIYRSSRSLPGGTAQVQWFDSGIQSFNSKGGGLSVRLVW